VTEPLDGTIDAAGTQLPARISVPPDPTGVVVFAHGSGSSRLSPRNVPVAGHLETRGFATVLFDLLTAEESRDRRNVFDIVLLGDRLTGAVRAARLAQDLSVLPVGLFGASTGAAAALVTAAELPADVRAVVSRGGRPDLAAEILSVVAAPTLLIVGERDPEVLELNRAAQSIMERAETRLEIVPGATHLFEEPGAMGTVAELAAGWFERNLAA
jgi:pimeloyl-ACP methyl ester carboxylesterase